MKRYSLIVALHIIGIAFLSVGVYLLVDAGLWFSALMAFLILIAIAVNLYRLQMIQVRMMRHLAESLRYDDMMLSFRSPYKNRSMEDMVDELSEAMRNFRTRVLERNEMEAWQKLIRVLTHEIMNAVTPITSLSDTLLGLTEAQVSKEEIRNGLQTISSTGKGLLSFVESYRKFTRIPTPEPSLFYVKSFIERMVELARHQHPDVRVTFHTDIAPSDLILYADENLVSQVVINLLKNAIQAIESDKNTDKEGHINIRAYCNEAEAILIEISNNGPAIPNDIAEHIFIPFFTTKEGGSGIGLSISRQIMRLSGGNLSLLPGKETTFILKFN